MEQLKQFNFVTFLHEAIAQDRPITVEMSTGRVRTGNVQLIDQVGPYPSFQLYTGEEDAPVVCAMAHVVTYGWQESDKRRNDAMKKSLA